MKAAYTVAQPMEKAFDVRRVGMFFEGMEIDYAYVKLIPVHAVKGLHSMGCHGLESIMKAIKAFSPPH